MAAADTRATVKASVRARTGSTPAAAAAAGFFVFFF